jgi:hypothetical protein
MDTVSNQHIMRVLEYLKPYLGQRLQKLHESYRCLQPAYELNKAIAESVAIDGLLDAFNQFLGWAVVNDWETADVPEEDDGHRWAEQHADDYHLEAAIEEKCEVEE